MSTLDADRFERELREVLAGGLFAHNDKDIMDLAKGISDEAAQEWAAALAWARSLRPRERVVWMADIRNSAAYRLEGAPVRPGPGVQFRPEVALAALEAVAFGP